MTSGDPRSKHIKKDVISPRIKKERKEKMWMLVDFRKEEAFLVKIVSEEFTCGGTNVSTHTMRCLL